MIEVHPGKTALSHAAKQQFRAKSSTVAFEVTIKIRGDFIAFADVKFVSRCVLSHHKKETYLSTDFITYTLS